jgi:hypothetical protein
MRAAGLLRGRNPSARHCGVRLGLRREVRFPAGMVQGWVAVGKLRFRRWGEYCQVARNLAIFGLVQARVALVPVGRAPFLCRLLCKPVTPPSRVVLSNPAIRTRPAWKRIARRKSCQSRQLRQIVFALFGHPLGAPPASAHQPHG